MEYSILWTIWMESRSFKFMSQKRVDYRLSDDNKTSWCLMKFLKLSFVLVKAVLWHIHFHSRMTMMVT